MSGVSPGPDTHVFLSNQKTGISTDVIQDVVAHYGEQAGISDLHPHVLRHTAARMLLAAGNDLVTVGRILGQSDVKTTARYCLPSEEDMRRAIARLEDEE